MSSGACARAVDDEGDCTMTKTAAKSSAIPILAIGLEEPAQSFVRTCLPEARMQRISTVEEFTASYERWGDGMFAAILCGPKVASIHNTEIAQVLLTQCPATPKYYITYDTTSFNARELIKNGFQSVFLLPMDQMLLKTALIDIILAAAKSRTFRPVRLFDLEPGSVLEFDTYIFLPLNNKYVKFSAANEPLDPSRFAKLTEHELRSIFVDRSDMRKFYAYASQNSRGEG
ncbi:MAG: hypothetical protein NDI61_04525, partial [Bdellovibrionaceae bacterium]|nr:hypothetical protein [Pseudobdellovibrionaceae bacterium]